MASNKLTIVASGAAGVLAAFATSLALGRLQPPESPVQVPSEEASATPKPQAREVIIQGAHPARLAAIERELVDLRSQLEDQREQAEEEAVPPEPEEERRQTAQRIATLETRFTQERPDPDWAPSASHALNKNLNQVAEKGDFTLVSAQCKSQLCRAEGRWKNFDEAVGSGRDLARDLTPGLNCTRSIYLPDPEDTAAPYSASLFMDCTEQRAGLADPIP